jgi:ADP-heptose:LPS heptosyltransferase
VLHPAFVGNAEALWLSLSKRRPGERPIERILILGYAAIGDLIFFLPALQAIRHGYPGAKITWVANAYPTTKELLPALGLVDEILLHDWEAPGAVEPDLSSFDLAVLTLSSPAHHFRRSLSAIPIVVGHVRLGLGLKTALIVGEPARRALLTRPVPVSDPRRHAVLRNMDLVEAIGLPRPPLSRPKLPVAVVPVKGRVGVHLAGGPDQYGKLWPEAKLRELAARFPGAVLVEAGKQGLLEALELIGTCSVFVSCDTGPAKAAMALGVPTVTLWGPTDPAELGAIWDKERHVDLVPPGHRPTVRLGMGPAGRLELDIETVHQAVRRKLE